MDSEAEQVSIADTARILSEALPFMQRYDEEAVVVKYGGHAMVEPSLAKRFASDIVLLKQCGINPIVVHGGGPQINRMLEKLQVKSDFVDGLRVTDKATMEVVEMVLAGRVNKRLVTMIQESGGRAVGLSGKDAFLLKARPHPRKADLGFVGEVESIDTEILEILLDRNYLPVVCSVGWGEDGETYNLNADTVASGIDRKSVV